jgi:adenylate cyclase
VAAFAIFLPIPVILGFAAYPLGFWSPIVVKESAVAIALVGGVVVNYATEGRRKLFIKHVFKHYLSPAVIEQILDNPSQLQLGGERRELTIFFSDLQGFSSFSERLDPPALTSLLNDYLSDMTDIILEEGGTLDKYEGDAIIAFWSAPVAQPDHAVRACRAALRCRRRLDERREEFLQKWGVLLRARIGINTGEVVVGNMGSRKRFDYTVLGDAANLASRLEGANKAFDTLIMVSETTWSQAAEHFVGREIGQLRVVGRKTPVRVFEILGLAEEADCPRPDAFHQGLALCYCGRYVEALAIFEDCEDDPVAKVYKDRCRTLLQSPEAAEWDGVWNLTEK